MRHYSKHYTDNDNHSQLIIYYFSYGGVMVVRLYTDNLNVAYDKQLIVNDLSVTIPDKQITAIIGPNGCGKSTLLKAVTRIIAQQSGTVILDGGNILKENTKT